jgi:hypothetical protein
MYDWKRQKVMILPVQLRYAVLIQAKVLLLVQVNARHEERTAEGKAAAAAREI